MLIRRQVPSLKAATADADDESDRDAWTKCTDPDTSEVLVDDPCMHGLVPAALFGQYLIWQACDRLAVGQDEPRRESQLLRGYPRDDERRGRHEMLFIELEPFGGDADIEGDHAPFPGVQGKVTRAVGCTDGNLNPKPDDDVLVNLLYAPVGTQEHALATVFARVENLAHVLVWKKRSSPVGCASFDRVELPRYGLNFQVKAHRGGANSGDTELRLWSVEHTNLYVDFEQSQTGEGLFADIPHTLSLRSEAGERVVLVPNVSIRRPDVKGRPFTTDCVIDHFNSEWIRHRHNQVYAPSPVPEPLSQATRIVAACCSVLCL